MTGPRFSDDRYKYALRGSKSQLSLKQSTFYKGLALDPSSILDKYATKDQNLSSLRPNAISSLNDDDKKKVS